MQPAYGDFMARTEAVPTFLTSSRGVHIGTNHKARRDTSHISYLLLPFSMASSAAADPPPEIWTLIVRLVVSTHGVYDERVTASVACVCHHWRDVVNAMRAEWCKAWQQNDPPPPSLRHFKPALARRFATTVILGNRIGGESTSCVKRLFADRGYIAHPWIDYDPLLCNAVVNSARTKPWSHQPIMAIAIENVHSPAALAHVQMIAPSQCARQYDLIVTQQFCVAGSLPRAQCIMLNCGQDARHVEAYVRNWYGVAGGDTRLFDRALATCIGRYDYLVVERQAVRASPYGGLSRYTVEEAV